MAPGLGRAIALVVCCCALLAVAWLPPDPTSIRQERLERMEQRRNTPALRLERETSRTTRALWSANEAVVFLERRDSLGSAYGQEGEPPRGVSAPDVPDVWQTWIAGQAAALAERRSPRASDRPILTALFVDTADWQSLPVTRRRRRLWSNTTIIALDSAAAPFSCLAIHDLRRGLSARARVLASVGLFRASAGFGVCRFFATYGEPGPKLRAWLTDGGWLFGQGEGESSRELVDAQGIRGLTSDGRYAMSACIQGSATACRSWVLHPRWSYDRLHALSAFLSSSRGATFDGLLSDLQDEMGTERFGRFWTSPLAVDSAFASAFDRDLGAWTLGWLDRRYGPLPHKGPRFGDFAVTVLVAGLLIAFAGVRGYGRNVRG